MPVNSDAVTRAELRRTRLDLIRREYEVNKAFITCILHVHFVLKKKNVIQSYHTFTKYVNLHFFITRIRVSFILHLNALIFELTYV